jgi:Na+/proline symporter
MLLKKLVWVGRFMVLAVAILAIVLSSKPDSKVLGLLLMLGLVSVLHLVH